MTSPSDTNPFPQGIARHYDANLEGLRAQLREYLAAVWVQAPILLRSGDLDQLLAMIAATVEASQISAANLTSAYLAQATTSQAVQVNSGLVTRRESGVAKSVVYRRAFRQYAIERNKPGISDRKAGERGLRRLQSIAATDVQMAVVRQSRASMQAAKRQYFRRIPTGRESCALCLIAATQRYKVADLMAIHGGCDCLVGPIPPGMDLDLVIDEQMLEATHQQVRAFGQIVDRGGRIPDYRELIVAHEHGEIGPVLGWRGQKFTGADDLKPPSVPTIAAGGGPPNTDLPLSQRPARPEKDFPQTF